MERESSRWSGGEGQGRGEGSGSGHRDTLRRTAKQAPKRGFHAHYDKLTHRDVVWRAWIGLGANGGAPGVDGVSIASIADGGVESVRAFLDTLAAEVEGGTYRPLPLRRVT